MVHRGRAFGHANSPCSDPKPTSWCSLIRKSSSRPRSGGASSLTSCFPRGLMLLDFDEHRVHRRVLSVAFKAGPDAVLSCRSQRGDRERPGAMAAPARVQVLSRDQATDARSRRVPSSAGELGPELEAVKRAFIAMVAASISVIRAPLPGTRFSRGVQGSRDLACRGQSEISNVRPQSRLSALSTGARTDREDYFAEEAVVICLRWGTNESASAGADRRRSR